MVPRTIFVLCALLASCTAAPSKVTGLVAATFTPLTANDTLDLSVVPLQAESLNKTGVFWAFVSGTTGESVDLTVAERKTMAEAWLKTGPDYGVNIIVHVGAESVKDAQDMARHAQDSGAYMIAAMPPTFFRPSSVQALVATMASIAAAAPETLFYYYHIPGKTNVNFNMRDFLAEADGKIPNLRGIKFSYTDLSDLQYCTQFKGGKYNILFGVDQQMLSALPYGIDGAVGSTYNFNGVLQNKILDAYSKGDMVAAGAAQFDANRFINSVHEFGVATGTWEFKVVQNIINNPAVGMARLPYLNPTQEQEDQLRAVMKDWCNNAAVGAPWCSSL